MSNAINSKTAQQIVDAVRNVCGQNINFIGEKGIILASTDPKRVDTFHEIGRQVILNGTTIEVSEDNSFYGTHKGVNIPISYNGNIIGAIGISGEPVDVRKYAYLAQKITVLILREHELDFQSHNQKSKLNYIIRSLISHEAINHDALMDFLSEQHIEGTDVYYSISIQINSRYNPNNLSLIERQIYQTFDLMHCKLYTFQYPSEYIALIPEKEFLDKQQLLQKLARTQADLLKIGVGDAQPFLKQYRSYRASQLALKSLPAQQSYVLYEQLNLEIILGDASLDVQDTFQKKVLGKLSAEDMDLLRIYYEENMSLSKTCQRLFLHKNTLQYKLDRIHRISGYNPRVFQDAAVFYCALKTAALNGCNN
ncbi:MAG: sugar diacid recognition domain-containing protein [Lachnospiraceae bacterium]|nr:sugar diacid recognition domain-containing protein [Lachnospiraceae bacterium]MDD3615230.1 sugar diacid recognition domain-containing protein [Lachnospiraceae bacterium]